MTDIQQTLNERGKRYGEFATHAECSQMLKQVLARFGGYDLKASDMREALDMICHKMARILNGDPNYRDSWVDIAGYAMLVANRLAEEGDA